MTRFKYNYSVADNELYQKHILKLIKAGQGELYVLKSVLELIDEIGQDDMSQNIRDMTEQELIKIEGMDEAYSNVRDLIDLIAVAKGYK